MTKPTNPLNSVIWKSRIEPALRKGGIDTSKIQPVQAAVLIGQLEADEAIQGDTIDEMWIDGLIEEHPFWEGKEHRRLRLAQDLIDSLQEHDCEGNDAEEIAKGRYAVFSWYDGSGIVRAGGDTIEGVLDVIHSVTYADDNPELVEAYFDLDSENCQRHEVTGGAGQLTTTITLALNGVEKTYTN